MIPLDTHTNDVDLSPVAAEPMSPEQRLVLVRSAVRQAHAHRARTIRALLRRQRRWLPAAAASARDTVWRLAGHLSATLACGWQAYAEWRRRLKATAALSTLSDHMLKDIGISRSEIASVVRHGRYKPPAQAADRDNNAVRSLTPLVERLAAKQRATCAAAATAAARKAA